MAQWVIRLRNNIFVNPPPHYLNLLCEISGAIHLAQPSLTVVSRPDRFFRLFVVAEKRVWSNDQGGLVSRTPRFSARRANHSDHHFL